MKKNIDELDRFLKDLEDRYLKDHLDSDDINSETWDFDVRAYCVFSHAAFEQFFEELAEHVVNRILDQWSSGLPISKRAATSLIAISMYSGNHKLAIANEKDEQLSPLAQISEIIRDNAKQLITRLSDNHGASLKYIRGLFIPLGITVEPGPEASSGLTLLARNRGAYAHKRSPQHQAYATYKPMAPKDALNATTDCLAYCRDLVNCIPFSPTEHAYTAEGLLRSSRLAEVTRAVRKIGELRNAEKPARRLPG